LAVLLIGVVVARASRHSRWMTAARGVVDDGHALVDLGSAGPAAAAPAQEMAHWDLLEQRGAAMAARLAAATKAALNSTDRSALASLTSVLTKYRNALHTSRTLRIGPPAPTPDQLQYADADTTQQLGHVADGVNRFEQLLATERRST
jgi:hypothetical protein